MRDSLRKLRDAGDTTFDDMDPDGELPTSVVPDHLVSATVDGMSFVEAKLAAMRAHATQIAVDGPFFALSNNLGNEVWGLESYRLVRGEPGTQRDAKGRETDLFDGVA
jgi:N-acetyl-1-D-myo-inositol-2-amino-2-deoxy-alpha-D-glucopyranoside deacetylase